MRKLLYDVVTYDLAMQFVRDVQGLSREERQFEAHQLAQDIQETIEDYISDLLKEIEMKKEGKEL